VSGYGTAGMSFAEGHELQVFENKAMRKMVAM
jgi:hypothetical protein